MIVKHRPFDPALDPKRATIKYRHLVLGRRVLFHETQRVVRPFMASAGLPEQGVDPVVSIVASLAWSKRQSSPDMPDPIDDADVHGIFFDAGELFPMQL